MFQRFHGDYILPSLARCKVRNFFLLHFPVISLSFSTSFKNTVGETPLYEAYLGKCAPVILLFSRRGLFLSALEHEKLKKLFAKDAKGKRLLEMPHEDALRRIRNQPEDV